jgi:dipeptidyl aminopeptidase/acylaminoacyl peptidase
MIRAMDEDVQRWNERGFATVNIDYAAGAQSMNDVLSFYDAVREWQGPDVPIAATGASAGGHLSMYIAAQRPDVSFVVSNAGPSDLTRLAGATDASKSLQAAVDSLFGAENLAGYSPAHNAASMGARVLAANAENDQLVLPDQARYMQEARPDLVDTLILQPGDRPYVHANVSQESLDELHRAEEKLAHQMVGDR